MMLSYGVLFTGLIFSSTFLPLEGIRRNSCTSNWVKLNRHVVCFGARGNRFGSFHNRVRSGLVAALKLKHLSGSVACTYGRHFSSYWGCANLGGVFKVHSFNAVVTDELNQIIFPKKQFIGKQPRYWYRVPFAKTASSKELVFSDFTQPFYFPKYEQMRIWYGEDLIGSSEADNHGRACVNVYAEFML